ncbi:uncharacterized protein LOC112568904 isoform X2 [Pomacea canaliculata]|uniref:uncharacterized protein LOC112568904 isoform X2 n=1 Tax=Pomacea canaliculata TaxID=400727 RepID=UPI000D7317B9|nr:uncharacterized protein LOC112568904 isoform X2 [Pomacea canaliculata]
MKTILVIHFVLAVPLRSRSENLTAVCVTSDSYWEVHSNKPDNTYTCTGLSAQDTVQWDHWVPDTSTTNLGYCPPRPADGSQSVCIRPLSPIFIPSRISDDTSVMLINASATRDTRLFDKGRMRCSAVRQTSLAGSESCRLDYIYAGANLSCTVQFRNDTWSVFGQCSTERVYSAQKRYRCEWIQTKEPTREEILISNISMTVVPSVGTYVSGSCNMTSYLPPVGQYTYRVTFVPGEVTVIASAIGNNTISRPSSKPSHNCLQYIPEGNDLRCTCSVSDLGSPPGVLQWNTTGSAELRVLAVQAGDVGTYTCQLLWNNTVVQSVEYTLTMASPPSIPVIFSLGGTTGTPAYPFLMGTSGILGCQSNQTGRPQATYSWPVPATGQASGSKLTFYNLSREDNGRTVKCRASNNYTANRRPVDDATFVLQVYYDPVINFTRFSDGSDCVKVSTVSHYKQCVVAEGQMVHINCTADSNPSPLSFRWLSQKKDVYSNSSELVITSANHTIHNGDYNCTVVTKQENMDSRLPLTSSAVLTVIVGYSPIVLHFTINNVDNMTVNVQEKSHVDMKCLCNGRPAPSIRLINVTDPEHFLNQFEATGNISVDEQRWGVNFSMDQVPCEASGIYKCDVKNSLGQDSQSRTLLVNCAPRGTFGDGNVNITSSTGELIVRMTAYPTPMVEKITFLGLNKSSDGEPVKENTIYVQCSASSLAPAAVTCNITVINMAKSEEGFYRIVFSNNLGVLPFIFSVTVLDQASEVSSQDQNPNTPAIIGGIFGALILVVIIIVTVFLLQRHRRNGSQSKSRSDHHPKTNQNKTADVRKIHPSYNTIEQGCPTYGPRRGAIRPAKLLPTM